MPNFRQAENDFTHQITQLIEDNISNENFGVSELADAIGMSRSNLLRKVKKLTNLSVSQFIRNVRLGHAKEMLEKTSFTVSEIAYKVGFGSPSYFIKCFGDYYGYPPGETGKMGASENEEQMHQLAAIMFTDIQDYTALMQQDEKQAVDLRNRHREIFNTVTKKHNGNILQYFGDGTLSTFNSAIDAVKCAIEMQLAFRKEPQIPVRIGIHTGDIIFHKDGIIGDGVNVASRIESLAVAGSVFISEKVFDEVKNQSGIECVSMGTFELKNVDKPLEVCAVANPGLIVPESGSGAKNLVRPDSKKPKAKGNWLKWSLIVVAAFVVAYLISISGVFELIEPVSGRNASQKKSIAVLPFINDSHDSANVYIINGLMESTLNNLQQIKDLRVISRTSVEKYRNNLKTTPEIAKELNASYLVEGSGQKIGDQIVLSIKLIEAATDNRLWSQQYQKSTQDIFKLQAEVAKDIAEQIEAIITPEEKIRIEKVPTENTIAYDYFLKGLDLLNKPSPENFTNSIPYFLQAIEKDNKFARAYAAIAIAYYFLDENKIEKQYSDSINYYADQAMFHDSKLPQSLIAKALFYMTHREFELAVPYFEKALEYNPNYDVVYVFLVDLYANYLPNTEKYLEYALTGLEIDLVAAYDSATASYSYLHISNAFIQSGFVDEAELYVNKSLEYLPSNLYSEYLKAYILYAKNEDLQQLNNSLLSTLEKDSTRLDVLQEVAKSYYYLGEYENALKYYKKFVEIKNLYQLNIYRSENGKIGVVCDKLGLKSEANKFFDAYKTYAEEDHSIYSNFSLFFYNAYYGDKEKAIEHLKLFSEKENFHYWTVLFTPIDPLAANMQSNREYKKIFGKIETNFKQYHKRVEKLLKEKGLIS